MMILPKHLHLQKLHRCFPQSFFITKTYMSQHEAGHQVESSRTLFIRVSFRLFQGNKIRILEEEERENWMMLDVRRKRHLTSQFTGETLGAVAIATEGI